MEESRFEYHYEETDGFIADYLKFIHFKMPSRVILFVVLAVLTLGYAGYGVYLTVIGADSARIWAVVIAFAVLYPLIFIFGYRRALAAYRRRKIEMYGDAVPASEAVITDDKIKFVNLANHAETVISLSSVVKVYETKTLIVLKTGGKLLNVYSKTGFTKGTPEEFVSFLHGKGIK